MTQLEQATGLVIQPLDAAPPRGIAGVKALAAARFGESLTLQDLAKAARMPTNTLTRRFKRTFGLSPMRWLWAFRVYLAAEIIAAAPGWTLTDVAVHCGFGSSAHFSRRFKRLFGENPSVQRRLARLAKGARLMPGDPLLAQRRELVERALRRLAEATRAGL